MEYNVDHLINKRTTRWKINFRAPIWVFILIFAVTLLFGGDKHEGFSEGLETDSHVSLPPDSGRD